MAKATDAAGGQRAATETTHGARVKAAKAAAVKATKATTVKATKASAMKAAKATTVKTTAAMAKSHCTGIHTRCKCNGHGAREKLFLHENLLSSRNNSCDGRQLHAFDGVKLILESPFFAGPRPRKRTTY
jgi:hypothetical protein